MPMIGDKSGELKIRREKKYLIDGSYKYWKWWRGRDMSGLEV